MIELKKILLVEDDPKDAELIITALEDHNLANRVITLQDGVEAIEYLRYEGKYKDRKPETPAVILLDVKMPRLDGIEVLRIIRNDAKLRNIPVVILTSSKEEPDLQRCYDLGVNAYIVKPVVFEEFIEAVRQIGIFWAILNQLPLEDK